MYKVLKRFKEKNHGDHIYNKGDTYPAEGKRLVKSRAEQLTKVHPKYGIAFLELAEEKPPQTNNEKAKNTNKNSKEAPEKSDA